MLALFVGFRPHPLTSAEKITCSLCSHSSWATAHTRFHRKKDRYRVPKGFPSGSYRVPSARSCALRSAPGALHGRRLPYGSSPADSLPAGHCGAPRAPSYVGGGRRAAGATPARLLASPRAPRPARAPRLLASPGRRAPCPRLGRPFRRPLCAAAGGASPCAGGLGGFAPAPRLPPNGSARFPAKAGCPPVRFGLRSRCAQPTQPAGSYRVPKGFPSGSCGSRSFAGAPWLGQSPALYLRPLRSATLPELVKRPPPLPFGGLCPPTAVSLIPSPARTLRTDWPALPRHSVLSSLPFDSILFRSCLFRATARFICLAAAGSALRAVAGVAAVGTGPVARASPRAGPQLPALVPPLPSVAPSLRSGYGESG